MKIGYARATVTHPDISNQVDALMQAGCHQIFTEDKSIDTKKVCLGLEAALNHMQDGDILVVWRLDCLAWSLSYLLKTVNRLENEGYGFQSLQEAIDTSTSDGQVMLRLIKTLTNFERNIVRERTKVGLTAARARGRKGGRPKGLSEKAKQTAVVAKELYLARELSIQAICNQLSISRGTLYNYLRHQGIKIGTSGE